MVKILAPISIGDLIDRITILEIKVESQPQLEKELIALREAVEDIHVGDLYSVLQTINRNLWVMENAIRQRMAQGDDCLVADAAVSIVKLNDERSRIKQQINHICGAKVIEEKVYK